MKSIALVEPSNAADSKSKRTREFGDIDRLIDSRPADGIFRVHRDALVDPDIFDLEMNHIFEATWVYLGHESQVAGVHDYLTTTIGRQQIVVMRDGDGCLNAFYNSCRHRGAILCQRLEGNARTHVCPYHGWAYSSSGENTGITNRDAGAYSAAFSSAGHDLLPIARFDTYRGLMFGSLDPDVPALAEHLGPVTTFIDLLDDQSPDGMELIPGRVTFTFSANWKWQIENATDSYHFPFVHSTYLEVLQRQLKRIGGADSSSRAQGGVSSYADLRRQRGAMGRGCFDLGNGHTAMWGPSPNAEARPLYLSNEELVARVGETRAKWMLYTRNVNIFPNLQLYDNIASLIGIIRPISVDRTEMTTYGIGPKGESDEARRQRVRHCEEFLNLGIANPDDLACYEACQAGFADHPNQWLDYARGMGVLQSGPSAHASELGCVPKQWVFGPFDMGDETGHQHGFTQWHRLLKRGLERTSHH